MTVSKLCSEYIDSRRDIVKQSTVAAYETLVRNHIEPQFGNTEACRLTKETVSKYYKSLIYEGFSETHIRSIGVFLRSVYNWGDITYGIENVCKQAYIPKMRKKMITVLTDEEKRKVLRHGTTAAVIALSMGLRIGEVCGLMGQDVEDGVLTVRRTVQRIQQGKGKTKLIVTQPKT